MLALVQRARRRLFYNRLLAQGANTASAALLAFIILLLAGAEVLKWEWLAVLPAAAACAGVWLARRRLPSLYVVAQVVDLRMALADTLSTALFFQPRAGSDGMADLQAAAAERMAETVDARRAVPFTMPHTAYAMAALLLVATSLFALRYAVSRRLDLKTPLAIMLQQPFGEKNKEASLDRPRSDPEKPQPQDSSEAAAGNKGDQARADRQEAESRTAGQENAERNRGEEGAEKKQGAAGAHNNAEEQTANAQDQGAEQQEDGARQGADRAANDGNRSQQGNQAGKQGDSRQDGNSGSQSSSLMSKLKDAFENLLSRVSPREGQSGGQQQPGDQSGKQGKGQQNGGKQQSAQNGRQQGGQPQANGQGEGQEKAPGSGRGESKGSGNSSADDASSKRPGSGIGSQDGDKSIKQAEELAAMGKISEIIGKRQQNISGETSVEAQSSRTQSLSTPYAERGALHTQTTADLNRDEIPAALQTYVEQYFEQVRKQQKK